MEFLTKYGGTRSKRPTYNDEWMEGIKRENERNAREADEAAAETGFAVGDKVYRKGHGKIGIIRELGKDVKGRPRATVFWPGRSAAMGHGGNHSTLLISSLVRCAE